MSNIVIHSPQKISTVYRHLLVKLGKEKFKNPKENSVHLVNNKDANELLNNLHDYPHAYVLACFMDRQIKAEKAWSLPFKVKREVGQFDIETLAKITPDEYKKIFVNKKLHRFNDKMAEVFYETVQKIKKDYNGDASQIWCNKPSSAAVVYRFLEFYGVGVKIATMAANILARQFKIEFSDYYSIDVSPDVHVKRVMQRMGLVQEDAGNDKIIYKARELNPEFPGIIDFPLWEIGKKFCKPNKPSCSKCTVKDECQYNLLVTHS
ncbi:MAG: hypothetical protein IJV35_05800 [Neisseriaceae bacterium]|nr:hypothetical protein [Neisseriaceae bacterium]